ncbi:hypothetical protein NHX12_009490 [Muraenolepis orangiensis]|uniref:VWA7 N-terminal domain-containing protein n=1 Tax=Muraenolepis orangiensis TaxID=630683 RepID=A0A9Q0DHW6_9TELE|nr:hypothetical protein NHX12_009490 [Muraenolepis orangiensis]
MRASAAYVAAVLSVLLGPPGALGFAILPGDSLNHQEITEEALFSATILACRSLAQSAGTGFNFPVQGVAVACSSTESTKSFRKAMKFVVVNNVRVDVSHPFNGSFHFDDELFLGGRMIIATGLSAVKASNRQGNFEAGREILGEILHPLQVQPPPPYPAGSIWVN